MSDEQEVEFNLEKAIRDMCLEYSASMIRAEAESDLRKAMINDLSERASIDKKLLRYCAKTYHNQNFGVVAAQTSEAQEFYANIFGIDLDTLEEKEEDLDADE